jgi:hypothetical protein
MTDEQEIERLWNLALTKTKNWQHSDFPVVRDSTAQLKRAWKSAKGKTRITNGEAVTVTMIELQWQAEARARQKDRQHKVFVPQPVGVSVWLNGERWNNEIVSEEPKSQHVDYCECGQPTHGPSYDKCTSCLPFENGKLKHYLGVRIDATGKQVSCYTSSPILELRKYYEDHPEIRGIGKEEALKHMKGCLTKMVSK